MRVAHESKLGNAHAHSLFERIQVKRKAGLDVVRSFDGYDVTVDESAMPVGVSLERRVG